MDLVNVPDKFKGRIALPVPGIIGGTQKFWQSLMYTRPRSLFSELFNGFFVQMDHVNVLAKFEVRSFTRSWDNSDWSFGWGLRTPILGRGGRMGSGMGQIVLFERALVSSNRLSITFPLAVVYAFQMELPLVCSSTPFSHPPLVSPKFTHSFVSSGK